MRVLRCTIEAQQRRASCKASHVMPCHACTRSAGCRKPCYFCWHLQCWLLLAKPPTRLSNRKAGENVKCGTCPPLHLVLTFPCAKVQIRSTRDHPPNSKENTKQGGCVDMTISARLPWGLPSIKFLFLRPDMFRKLTHHHEHV